MQELPKIVRQGLAKGEAGPHLEADLLAAFSEGNLAERERRVVLTHLSSCSDCREIIALAIPASDAAVPSVSLRKAWLSWSVLRWGAAVACVAVVGAAISIYREQPEKYSAGSERTVANKPQTPERAAKLSSQPASAGGQIAEKKAAEPAAPSAKKESADGSLTMPAKTLAKRADAAAAPAVVTGSLADSATREVEKKQTFEEGKAKEASAADFKAAPASNISAMSARSAPSAQMALSSGMSPRWTLNSDGTLQRSLDGGKTWNTIPVSSDMRFRVVSAVGSDVWVGGGAGTLFHSPDAGEHWSQVKASDGERTLADDITAIQFTDSTHGKVTTSHQEVWATDDGGTTWQQLW